MKRVEITAYGGPDVMRLAEAPVPIPGPGQLLIRTEAAGVNPVDWKLREGVMREVMPLTMPAVIGSELTGIVEATGAGVTGFAPGDPVLAATGLLGAFAEYVVLDAELAVRRPAGLDRLRAAALPVAAATAAAALAAGDVGRDTRILVHAAAGGVGTILVQLAIGRGARVTAVGSAGSIGYLQGLGVTDIVDRASPYENGPGEYDVVVDGVGPEAQARSWRLLKNGGLMLTLVAPPSAETAAAYGVRATMVYGSPNPAALSEVARLVASDVIKVTVQKTYALDQAVAALAESQAGGVRGKLVLTMG